MQSTRRLGHLMALAAMTMLPSRPVQDSDGDTLVGGFGSSLDTMDPALIEQKYGRKLDEIEMATLLNYGSEWQEKTPPTRSGNNRANNCEQRRARNKAARKTRMQQRRRAKKG